MKTQEDINVKMEHKLNALSDVVQSLGDDLQSLKTREQLKCHTNYEWNCITSSVYKESLLDGRELKHILGESGMILMIP